MIVICTTCQAKFRVADDRVGPRGAKVRCSKCQTIFVVQRPAGTAAPSAPPAGAPSSAAAAAPPAGPSGPSSGGLELDLEAGRGPPSEPFAWGSPPPPAPISDPFSAPLAAPAFAPMPSPAPDPIGAAAPLGAPAAPDPFAAAAPRHADPFATVTAAPDPFAAAPSVAADPFAAAAAPDRDPFAAPPAERGGADPFAAGPAAPEVRPELHADLSEFMAPPAPAAPSPALMDAAGLSLEDRTTPAPAKLRAGVADVPGSAGFAGADPFASPGAEGWEDEPSFEEILPDGPGAPTAAAAAPGGGASAAATDDAELTLDRAPRVAPGGSAPGPAAVAAPTRPTPRPAAGAPALQAPRPSRLRSVAVNALSLVALLAVAGGFLAVWRGEGAAGLRPSALLAAIGRGDAGPFRATDVTNGFYDRERGPPLLFVRGRVVSSAPAAVPGVKVEVEIVRGATVVARGEAWAGAIPTPEELWAPGPATPADPSPHALSPGQALPFLVAIPDPPPDVDGARVRIALAPRPAGGARE